MIDKYISLDDENGIVIEAPELSRKIEVSTWFLAIGNTKLGRPKHARSQLATAGTYSQIRG